MRYKGILLIGWLCCGSANGDVTAVVSRTHMHAQRVSANSVPLAIPSLAVLKPLFRSNQAMNTDDQMLWRSHTYDCKCWRSCILTSQPVERLYTFAYIAANSVQVMKYSILFVTWFCFCFFFFSTMFSHTKFVGWIYWPAVAWSRKEC